MENEKRPLGITLLASVAFCASAALVTAAIYLASGLVSMFRERREYPEDLSAYIGLSIALICILILAAISSVAGVDLRRLRKRGRSLTIVSMIFMCLLGTFFVVVEILDRMEDKGFFWVGLAICTLSVPALLYLYHPQMRQRFAMAPPTKID